MNNWGLHWFRRDLRVAGNEALQKNWKKNEGRVVGVFCFDPIFLSRDDFSVDRFQFFLKSIQSLKNELQKIGSDLLVLDKGPDEAFKLLLDAAKQTPSLITWNRDYEPFARERDDRLEKYFHSRSIETQKSRDHLIIEPDELSSLESKPYKVYTPFSRRWLKLYNENKEISTRVSSQKTALKYLDQLEKNKTTKIFKLTWNDIKLKSKFTDVLEDYVRLNAKKTKVPIPEAGSLAAYRALKSYEKSIDNYSKARDFPFLENATSGLSVFFKNGTLTTSIVLAYFDLQTYFKPLTSRDRFFSELIWREFYYHILFHFPYVENLEFIEKYRELKWSNDKNHLKLWTEGKTGYPIVDAGMRELNATGLMHNRCRMIVASFLVKDLLIDWRWGEKYFMDRLLDGDLAPNNGGWQWAASTGCDPQPYFRIFNPWLQAKKFDPEALYIKKWIPELKSVEPKTIHNSEKLKPHYPPIVDHAVQRNKALELYKAV